MKTKIYTKSGDQGQTSLIGGQRVSKTHPHISAYGTVDELNCSIGHCRSILDDMKLPNLESLNNRLLEIQNYLFSIGSHLACENVQMKKHLPPLEDHRILSLETDIDSMTDTIPPLTQFILPGGHLLASTLHLSRTICRRAERETCMLEFTSDLIHIVKYLNRLSDYFFVCARYVNHQTQSSEIIWNKEL